MWNYDWYSFFISDWFGFLISLAGAIVSTYKWYKYKREIREYFNNIFSGKRVGINGVLYFKLFSNIVMGAIFFLVFCAYVYFCVSDAEFGGWCS